MVDVAYKVLNKGMISKHRNVTWKKGVWKTHKGYLVLCESGFHASKLLPDAINFITPGIICKVEYRGEVIEGDDKLVAREMKVVETYSFTKRMAVEFSVFCARQCLEYYEKEYPNDKRVRLAIVAAEKWLKSPTKKNISAARSAGSAAWSAWFAARSARSARSAAWSAWSAARSAAWSAWFAAQSAGSAAWSARSAARSAGSAAKREQHKKLLKILNAQKEQAKRDVK